MVYSLTHSPPRVLAATKASHYLFSLAIILFVSGELVWRERQHNIHELFDSLPIANGVAFASKLLAIWGVQVLLVFLLFLCCLFIQIDQDFTQFEFSLYFKELFGVRLMIYLLISVCAMFVQVVVNKKFWAMFITFFLVDDALPMLGFEHHLWRFASVPEYIYSDIAGYGPFSNSIFFYLLFWSCLAFPLILIASTLISRGLDTRFLTRIKNAYKHMSKGLSLAVVIGLVGAISLGSFIFYNTTILNAFESSQHVAVKQVEYEEKYKAFAAAPQPKIVESLELIVQSTILRSSAPWSRGKGGSKM